MRVIHHRIRNLPLERLVATFPEVTFVEIPDRGPLPDEVHGEVCFTTAFGGPLLREALAPERRVRWVHVYGTGIDRFPTELIDGHLLTCARGASAIAISEWCLAMMLAFEKQVPETWIDEPPEQWFTASLGGLHGKTLGIVGIGSIGQQVARRALAFGMEVRALRRTRTPSPVAGVEIETDLLALLGASDHVVIAAPATPETNGLIGERALAAVKPGVHLVNVARGDLVDQEALRDALDRGAVARASLDTVTPEPLPAGHWLFEHPAVRLSAHVSWNVPESGERQLACFVANLRHYLAGEPLEGVVDLATGY